VRTTTTRDGHCWYLYGQDVYYRLATNSWGTAWGEGGLFKMRRCDFTKLMHAGGEAWAVVQPAAPPKPAAKPSPLAGLLAALMRWLKGRP
jgi:hypothetical protein